MSNILTVLFSMLAAFPACCRKVVKKPKRRFLKYSDIALLIIIKMADVALELIPKDAVAIGGLTMGADPVAYGIAAVAATRGVDLRSFSVRKEAKDHGVTGRIAGALQPGDKVVITEDTVTRGTSIMEAVDAVIAFGAIPVLITVVVDRGGTCGAMAAERGIPFIPMLTAPDLGYGYGT